MSCSSPITGGSSCFFCSQGMQTPGAGAGAEAADAREHEDAPEDEDAGDCFSMTDSFRFPSPRLLSTVRSVLPKLASGLREGLHILNGGVVLDDGASVEDEAAIAPHLLNHFLHALANLRRLAVRQQRILNAAGNGEFVVQNLMNLDDVITIAVEDNAAFGQFAEGLQVVLPLALGVEQNLPALPVQFENNGFECGPINGVKCLLRDQRLHVLCVDTVSYTHLTLPTICSVQISVVAVSLKKKKTKK
eukprot:TRINITY_DN942_c0_g1_i1.p2 TRINITY_DN942_c0_g1~~TRINITY_DN942_c0_g1_i1.p2  ORF type:complete len:247 (+),score=26.07 TRINITY_DN942_c0_g1_i1:2447-3187(+)